MAHPDPAKNVKWLLTGILLVAIGSVVAMLLSKPAQGPYGEIDRERTTANVPSPARGPVARLSKGEAEHIDVGESMREPEAVAPPKARERAQRPRARRAEGPPAQLIARIVGPDGRPVPEAQFLASTRDSLAPLGFTPERGVAVAVSNPEGGVLIPAATSSGGTAVRLSAGETLRALVRAPGYAILRVPRASMSREAPHDLGELRLERGRTLTGTVVAHGRPVAGARVLLGQTLHHASQDVVAPGQGWPVATTDADGQFRVDEAANGPFQILVEAAGYPVVQTEGVIEAGRTVDALQIELERASKIAGRVIGAPEHLRLAVEARLTVDPAPGSEAEGRARQLAVAEGGKFQETVFLRDTRYELSVVILEDPLDPTGSHVGLASEVKPVVVDSDTVGVRLEWRPKPAIAGRVVGPDGQPVKHFTLWAGTAGVAAEFKGVAIKEHGEPKREFPGGRFFVRDAQRYCAPETPIVSLRIRAAGFADRFVGPMALPSSDTLDAGDIKLRPRPAVRIRVVDFDDGRPIAGARVHLAAFGDLKTGELRVDAQRPSWGRSIVRYGETNASGVAMIPQPDLGPPFAVVVGAGGFAASGQVLCSRTDGFEVVLHRGARLAVQVVDSDGANAPGVRVQVRSESRTSGFVAEERRTNGAGKAQFDHMPHGAFSVSVQAPSMEPYSPSGWGGSSTTVQLAMDEDARVVLTAPHCVAVAGTIVMGRKGPPVAGARIELAVRHSRQRLLRPASDNVDLRARTGQDGRFEFARVPVGRYEAIVFHPSTATAVRADLRVSSEGETHVIELPNSSIEGRVVFGGSEDAASGVEVTLEVLGSDVIAAPDALVLRRQSHGGFEAETRASTIGRARTDARGRFVFGGVDPDTKLRVAVTGGFVAGKSLRISTPKRGQVIRDLVLRVEAAGELEMTEDVVDRWTTAATVQARRLDDDGAEIKGGLHAFRVVGRKVRPLPPGRYRVGLTNKWNATNEDASLSSAREITVAAGETTAVHFK